jgi:hypothetical protein
MTNLTNRNRQALLGKNLLFARKRLATAEDTLRVARANRGDTTTAQQQVDFHSDQVEWITGLLTPAPSTTEGAISLPRGRHRA